MPNDLISKQTRNAFREAMSGYWVLRMIDEAFENEGVKCNLNFMPPLYIIGQRRTLVEQYYSTLSFTDRNDVDKVLNVFELVIRDVNEPEKIKLLSCLSRDGHEYNNGRICSAAFGASSLEWASELASGSDLPQLDKQVRRIAGSVDSDPDLAIGTAKELLETVCKTILRERKVNFDENEEFSPLVRKVQKNLKLMPDDIDQNARGARIIKRILSNLGEITRGMSEVRNLYGTGHGKHGQRSSLNPRHAKLVVGAATTFAVFLYETHLETKEPTP